MAHRLPRRDRQSDRAAGSIASSAPSSLCSVRPTLPRQRGRHQRHRSHFLACALWYRFVRPSAKASAWPRNLYPACSSCSYSCYYHPLPRVPAPLTTRRPSHCRSRRGDHGPGGGERHHRELHSRYRRAKISRVRGCGSAPRARARSMGRHHAARHRRHRPPPQRRPTQPQPGRRPAGSPNADARHKSDCRGTCPWQPPKTNPSTGCSGAISCLFSIWTLTSPPIA